MSEAAEVSGEDQFLIFFPEIFGKDTSVVHCRVADREVTAEEKAFRTHCVHAVTEHPPAEQSGTADVEM